jgi:hypothetical protein
MKLVVNRIKNNSIMLNNSTMETGVHSRNDSTMGATRQLNNFSFLTSPVGHSPQKPGQRFRINRTLCQEEEDLNDSLSKLDGMN